VSVLMTPISLKFQRARDGAVLSPPQASHTPLLHSTTLEHAPQHEAIHPAKRTGSITSRQNGVWYGSSLNHNVLAQVDVNACQVTHHLHLLHGCIANQTTPVHCRDKHGLQFISLMRCLPRLHVHCVVLGHRGLYMHCGHAYASQQIVKLILKSLVMPLITRPEFHIVAHVLDAQT